jgi:hypothetical protein
MQRALMESLRTHRHRQAVNKSGESSASAASNPAAPNAAPPSIITQQPAALSAIEQDQYAAVNNDYVNTVLPTIQLALKSLPIQNRASARHL